MTEIFTPTQFATVSPSELQRLEVLTRRCASSDLSGEFRSTFRGTGLTFSDLREYVPGDDVKHINWRATARTNKTYVKTFEEDRSLRIHCALDVSRSLGVGGSRSPLQIGLELTSLVASLALQNRDSFSLSLFADNIIEFIPNAQSRHHLHTILRTLTAARVLPKATNLKNSLNELAQKIPRRSIIFIISDFIDSDFKSEIKYLSKRHDVIAAYLDPFMHIPDAGIVSFSDAESGRIVELDTSNSDVKKYILKKQKSTSDNIKQIMTSCGASFLQVGTSAVRALYDLSRQRAKLWR